MTNLLTYYHVTPAENIPSILENGLLTKYSRHETQAVWVVQADGVEWAVDRLRDEVGRIEAVGIITITLDEQPKCMRVNNTPDFYRVERDVLPSEIQGWGLIEARAVHMSAFIEELTAHFEPDPWGDESALDDDGNLMEIPI